MPATASWARGCWEDVHPDAVGGAYVDFMMEEGPARVRATYGDDDVRLQVAKHRYDPTDLFHVNQNIEVADPVLSSTARHEETGS